MKNEEKNGIKAGVEIYFILFLVIYFRIYLRKNKLGGIIKMSLRQKEKRTKACRQKSSLWKNSAYILT